MKHEARDHAREVASGERFEFGANWQAFLGHIDESRIALATTALSGMLREPLAGRTFLDIGSGSGLSSLAAHRLGARVYSFDFDPSSVWCTTELRRRYGRSDTPWTVDEGSVLDRTYLASLGKFDVVYSWGVLHHTGAMWEAMRNAAELVNPGGQFFVAIYNDQGRASRRWLRIKRSYNALPAWARGVVLYPALLRLWGPTILRDALRGRPLHSWRTYARDSRRGMDAWRDVVDWVGGYPFEVAKPEQILEFGLQRGFVLSNLTTCAGGIGCNEFVFTKT